MTALNELPKVELALANTDKALNYYLNIFARPNQEARIRSEALTLTGLLAYKEYLTGLVADLTKEKPKRGNPNFGKNNPYNPNKKHKEAEVAEVLTNG